MTAIGKSASATGLIFIATGYCELSTFIISQSAKSSAIHWLSVAQGISVNFVYLGVCTVIFVFVNPAIIPEWYYASKRCERDGQIYRFAGIHIFEAILRSVRWQRLIRKDSPVGYDLEALQKILDRTRGAEAIHLLAAVLTGVFTLSATFRYPFVGTTWWWAFNVLLNAYPVMLQRYHRPRIERLIARIKSM